MLYALCLGLFLPLLGFLGLMGLAYKLGRQATAWIACSTIFISFVCFVSLLHSYVNAGMRPESFTLFSWIPVQGIDADFSLHLDSLALLMALIITGIGFLIHVYSIGYMEEEEDFVRYFACLNFFVFAMLLLVLASNLLLLFVGWEGVGLASYLLIGFWYNRPAAARAATKAFVVNRIGDFGFLLGLLLTFYLFDTGEMTEISRRASQEFLVGAPVLTLLTLLYFVGAVGKSAQLPLHVWLPDAMEGPTPVSALIHAATMVTAGVYLVVRMHAVFVLAPTTLQVIGVIGATTSLFAALCAIGQTDLKRVLAYSTVSQLGFMFLACGAAAFYSAMFHLTTHAFIKALLFLSAGNVIHRIHGLTDMTKMGGLSKNFPKTHWLFLIGVLALSGVPPLAAFFSKDLILEQEYLLGFETLFYVSLAASILTGFYLTRAYCLTFMGKPRLADKELTRAKEAPRVMLLPLIVLALLSIAGGFLGFGFGPVPPLENFLKEIGVSRLERELTTGLHWTPELWLAILGSLFGIGLSALLYTRYADRFIRPILWLRKAFFIDEIYEGVIVLPLKTLSRFIAQILEPKVFDGLIRLAVQATQKIAYGLQQMQSGQIRSYVAWMAMGAVLLIVYFVL
jgi:NADH-quinone oxidoreductase subunit L